MQADHEKDDPHRDRRAQKSSLVRYLIIGGLTLVLIGIALLAWYLVYAPSARGWVRCTVTSASAGHIGGRGGGPAILIGTKDCGRLAYRWMVTDDNQDQIATRFKSGTPYDFLMAPVDRWVAAHPNPILDLATVWSYRPASR